MSYIHPSILLRRALQADGVVCATTGLVLLVATAALATLFEIPEVLLRGVGIFLLLYGLFVGWLGMQGRLPRVMPWLVIIGNTLWAIESIWLVVTKTLQPSLAGIVFVIGQALVAALVAEVQYLGLRRAAPISP